MTSLLALFPLPVLLFGRLLGKRAAIASGLLMIFVFFGLFQINGSQAWSMFDPGFVSVLALAVAALLSLNPKYFPLAFLPFLTYLGIGVIGLWSSPPFAPSVLVALLVFILSWTAGNFLSAETRQLSERDRDWLGRFLVVILFLLVSFELVVTLLQNLGFGVFETTGRTQELEGDRPNGTFSHPSVLGKVFAALLVLLLPLTRAREKFTSRLALVTVAVGLAPVALTQSRTNFVAYLSIILIWSVLLPREKGSFGQRVLLPLAAGGIGLYFLDQILARFQADTEGGLRGHFLEVALIQLERTPWWGIGPGAYVRVVGEFDSITAEGWPVHNIFVLEAVELGLVGAALLFLPIIVLYLRVTRNVLTRQVPSDYSRSLIAFLPAFILIGATGWGFVTVATGGLLFFTFGYARERVYGAESAGVPEAARGDLMDFRSRGGSNLFSDDVAAYHSKGSK